MIRRHSMMLLPPGSTPSGRPRSAPDRSLPSARVRASLSLPAPAR